MSDPVGRAPLGAPRVRAVIAAYGCAEHLERTLAAWERARERSGAACETAVVLPEGDAATGSVSRLAPEARVVVTCSGDPDTPGGSRNAGAAGATAEFLLFLDGDVEMDEEFLARALAHLERNPRTGGYGGRVDEIQWHDGREVARVADILGAGTGRAASYLAPVWLCRRGAFEEAGRFDPRLPSEEDFDLGQRLRERGWTLRMDAAPAGIHHCAPRPTLAELGRRWRRGMFAGAGLALRAAWGSARFGELLWRQRVSLAAVALALAGVAVAGAAALGRPAGLAAWLAFVVLGYAWMAARKRSLRLALLAMLSWVLSGTALLGAWITGEARRPAGRAS
jgi:hypothetical protein